MIIACVLLAVMSASAFLFAPMHQTAVYMRSLTCVASKGGAFDNQHTVEEAAEPGECRKYTAAAQSAEPLPALSIVRDRVVYSHKSYEDARFQMRFADQRRKQCV
jgi:hypothetical protein